MMGNVTKLNALRRLTLKPHAESPAPRKHKVYTVRVFDGDRVVGQFGYADLVQADAEFHKLAGAEPPKRGEEALRAAIAALRDIACHVAPNPKDDRTAMRNRAVDALAEIGGVIEAEGETG
jgi:hypothetical protein